MIKTVEMYTIICDKCGKDYGEEGEYRAWNDKDYVRDDSHYNDWVTENNNDYCPDCYNYDDEDNLIIKDVVKSNQEQTNSDTCLICGKRKVKIEGGYEHICTQITEKI